MLNALGRFRWTICTLLFAAMVINYMDRQSLALLKPTLQHLFGWNEIDYSHIVLAFTVAYGFGAVAMGRLMDYLGTRRGFSLSITTWSLAEIAHAAVTSVGGFIGVRVALGIGESASFPAAIKATAECFPAKDRALATGLFNSGTAIGAIITPLLLPLVVLSLGWRAGFVVTGVLGLAWLIFWLTLRNGHPEATAEGPRAAASALRHAQDDNMRWIDVFPQRATWGFAIAKFLTDPVWTTIYLFWLPDFFSRTRHLDLKSFGLPLATIYLFAVIGSIAGGWLSSTLIKSGWTPNAARKLTMLICAICVLPIVFITHIASLWAVVAIIGIAAGAHQGFSANLFTMTSDTFETRAVGSVVGIGQLTGSLGGMLAAWGMGQILYNSGSYAYVFFIPAGAYLIALGVIQLLMPRLERARLRGTAA